MLRYDPPPRRRNNAGLHLILLTTTVVFLVLTVIARVARQDRRQTTTTEAQPVATVRAIEAQILPEVRVPDVILPDSKFVYGPSALTFSTAATVAQYRNSYLPRHTESVEGRELDGVEIVQLVAERTRVDPRILLTALEMQSGWLTGVTAEPDMYPLGYRQTGYEGLYRQAQWTADQLNWGYYARAESNAEQFQLADGSWTLFDQTQTFGTSAIVNWLAKYPLTPAQITQNANSFHAKYVELFGDMKRGAADTFWTGNEPQPPLRLPWPNGETWYFTGGPHGGWNGGSAWAALDFAPSQVGQASGCSPSAAWAAAVADGVIARSEAGAVVLDLDGDGYAGTGWAVIYQHIATEGRIPVGSTVRAGDLIGHPSCEGGVSTASHLHLARTYNGRWISADQSQPFNLGGWVSSGSGSAYNGTVRKDGTVKSAIAGAYESNAIISD